MQTTQVRNLNGQRQELNLTVSFVKGFLGTQKVNTIKRKNTTVQPNATQAIESKTGKKKSNQHGKEVLAHMRHTEGGLRKIQNEWHILKQDDMLGSETQKAHTPLKIGKSFVKSLITNVLLVGKTKNLPKTILNHYQKVEAIIFQTYNLSVGIVIVGNGKLTSTRTLIY